MHLTLVMPAEDLPEALAIIGKTCQNLQGIRVGKTSLWSETSEAAVILINSSEPEINELPGKFSNGRLRVQSLQTLLMADILMVNSEMERSTWSNPDPGLSKLILPFKGNHFDSHIRFEGAVRSQMTPDIKKQFGGGLEVLIEVYRSGWVIPEKTKVQYGPQPVRIDKAVGKYWKPHSLQAKACKRFIDTLKSAIDIRDGKYK